MSLKHQGSEHDKSPAVAPVSTSVRLRLSQLSKGGEPEREIFLAASLGWKRAKDSASPPTLSALQGSSATRKSSRPRSRRSNDGAVTDGNRGPGRPIRILGAQQPSQGRSWIQRSGRLGRRPSDGCSVGRANGIGASSPRTRFVRDVAWPDESGAPTVPDMREPASERRGTRSAVPSAPPALPGLEDGRQQRRQRSKRFVAATGQWFAGDGLLQAPRSAEREHGIV